MKDNSNTAYTIKDEDLALVSGGYIPGPATASVPSLPGTSSESISVPHKGETVVFVDASVSDPGTGAPSA